jgi:hypothetical protein
MSEKTIYVWLALVAGAFECLAALLIFNRSIPVEAFIWCYMPFVFLSIYLAIKGGKLGLSAIRVMWCYAMLTAFIIYLVAFNYMEMHHLEGQRISGTAVSPRNMLIFLLLPFAAVCLMWVSMQLGKALEKRRGKFVTSRLCWY